MEWTGCMLTDHHLFINILYENSLKRTKTINKKVQKDRLLKGTF